MRAVAILGSSDLGGALAHLLAVRDVAREIRLIDDATSVAAGKALDISQAAPIEGFATRVTSTSDLASAGDVAVIVIADRASGGEWAGPDGLMLVRRLGQIAPRVPIVCAGAAARDLIERGVRDERIDRARLFGSAPAALVAATRAIVALAADASPADVALAVLGVPPAQIVIAWQDATIGGFAATRLLDEPARRRLDARLPHLWPLGPYALAAAAAQTVEVMLTGSPRLLCCFVAPDDGGGMRTRAAALPVRVGASGLERVVLPPLSVYERVQLDNAMLL